VHFTVVTGVPWYNWKIAIQLWWTPRDHNFNQSTENVVVDHINTLIKVINLNGLYYFMTRP